MRHAHLLAGAWECAQLEMLLRDYDIHELVEFISGDAR
jgi:hypothetical protein